MGQSIPDMPPRRVAYELARHTGATQDDLISRMTVRGNARLRRKLNASKRDNVRYRYHIAMLVTLLDRVGLGDHPETKSAANSIGWGRSR